jgi:hypothetical protein
MFQTDVQIEATNEINILYYTYLHNAKPSDIKMDLKNNICMRADQMIPVH